MTFDSMTATINTKALWVRLRGFLSIEESQIDQAFPAFDVLQKNVSHSWQTLPFSAFNQLSDNRPGAFLVGPDDLARGDQALSGHEVRIHAAGSNRAQPDRLTPASLMTANGAPYNIEFSDPWVQEHMMIGLIVGQFSASDPDGDPLTYTLVDDANGAVALEGDFLVVKDHTKIDYEQSPTLSFTISISDGINEAVEKTFVIDVLDASRERVVGTSADNLIMSGGGNDTLDGGLGADTLIGGLGDDTYYVDNAGDIVTEDAGEGIDTVYASISYGLNDYVENLVLTGSASMGLGNALANRLEGNDANNLLAGGGGADTLIGGLGDDTYKVDDTGDIVTEMVGEGIDIVRASINYSLSANVENLVLTGYATTGIGNRLDNQVTGNAWDNILNGGDGADTLEGGSGADTLDGGAGVDTMIGGLGDDTYYVDDAGDVVVEDWDQGIDTVVSSIDYSLYEGVENLTLIGSAKVGYGNDQDNRIIGNDADNTLEGFDGIDTLMGGLGNDTYIVNGMVDVIVDDVIVEQAGEGIDRIVALWVSWVLGANLENLELIGHGAFNGTGNELDNIISGNAFDNLLDGASGADTLTGGYGADTLIGGLGADMLIGGLSNDTYYVDNSGDLVVESANEGDDTVYAAISYKLGDNVENLVLQGSASIDGTGNSLNNVITGNAHNNVLDGGLGADTMIGGLGDDTYYVDDSGDIVIEEWDEGTDTVISSIDYNLGAVETAAAVENLTLTGSARFGSGNDQDNRIIGNDADNVLEGFGGIDTLIGGLGNDTYIVNDTVDVIVEQAGQGVDLVAAQGVNWVLGANLENLQLLGHGALNGTGNELDNIISGNAYDNLLDGASGADTLTGGYGADTLIGGLGADMLIGGQSDDTYYVDNASDIVTEYAGEGNDTVYASISYRLSDNVENLILQGSTSIDGTGNSLNNVITGNSGNNLLDGLAGIDTLIGGAGNDTYWVDANDTLIENANEGIDTVCASISYTLSANLENLILLEGNAEDGSGNALDNTITGNSSRNRLFGKDGNDTLIGGASGDTMAGGRGNDTYDVDNAADFVNEVENEGTDTVYSSVTYTLSDNVENLVLKAGAAIKGTGNSLGNAILGNELGNLLYGLDGNDTVSGGAGNDQLYGDNAYLGSGNDSLDGGSGNDQLMGGNGNDTLTGGTGSDVFILNYGASGSDTILDFVRGEDLIGLYAYPSTTKFVADASPATSYMTIVYLSSTGQLYADPDGIGAAGAILIASFTNKPALTLDDFRLL